MAMTPVEESLTSDDLGMQQATDESEWKHYQALYGVSDIEESEYDSDDRAAIDELTTYPG